VSTAYVAKSALVLARDEEGSFVYLYAGARVPSSIPQDEIDRLANDGHLEKVSVPAEKK
jgi:hypothetical protein